MSGISNTNTVPLTGRDIELNDTEIPLADHRDHMGRTERHSLGQAFMQDLPWIVALTALTAFVVAAMGGYLPR
jgi:hypothetical protein